MSAEQQPGQIVNDGGSAKPPSFVDEMLKWPTDINTVPSSPAQQGQEPQLVVNYDPFTGNVTTRLVPPNAPRK